MITVRVVGVLTLQRDVCNLSTLTFLNFTKGDVRVKQMDYGLLFVKYIKALAMMLSEAFGNVVN